MSQQSVTLPSIADLRFEPDINYTYGRARIIKG